MINLDQLRIFQAVAEARSFTRAADVVHLTQPGISKHIKQMEEHYRLPLFDRLGKKVALTQAGEILSQATQEIMASITAAEQRIEELKGLRGGKLILGASFPLGIYILPAVLAAFRKQYPAVEVTVDISLSAKIIVKILANKLDLGLVSREVHDPRLLAREFMTDELIAIAPRSHRWANKSRIRPQELLGETFIVAGRGAGTRTVVEERLKQKGIVLTNVVDFGNIEGVKKAVEAGLGVSIQAQSVVQREISAGSLTGVTLAGMDAKLGRFYICRKDKHLFNAAKAFLALLQTQAHKLA
jgi:LysR family transcriptional regulator, transcriptional activator of the cysJI operon